VCEDLENESSDGEISLNYEEVQQDKGKRERIKQLQDPHQIMHE
jgi:hypothetical protein